MGKASILAAKCADNLAHDVPSNFEVTIGGAKATDSKLDGALSVTDEYNKVSTIEDTAKVTDEVCVVTAVGISMAYDHTIDNVRLAERVGSWVGDCGFDGCYW